MRLRIAMLGSRGLPATYGGVEHHVAAISRRLVERGHDVTVYSQSAYMGDDQRAFQNGVRVVRVPSVNSMHLEAMAHSLRSTLDAMGKGYDILHYHAVGPGYMTPVPRLLSDASVVQTIHGLDANRAKWSPQARLFLRGATWLSARVPDRTIVVSKALQQHYQQRYGRACTYITNGTETRQRRSPDLITAEFGLTGQDYVLFVGRLVPEKNVDLLLRAYANVATDKRLVIVGGSSYTDDYSRELRRLADLDDRVVLTGYQYGPALDEFFGNAAAFAIPSALEGLPLTLLEATESALPIVASDIPPHMEVIESDRPGARVVPVGDEQALAHAIQAILDNLDDERRAAEDNRRALLPIYNWDRVVDSLEQVYYSCRTTDMDTITRVVAHETDPLVPQST